jgi:hypothetical protein
MRSRTIEELQFSLNLLIEKYNELKKKFDVVVSDVKERKLSNSNLKQLSFSSVVSFNFFGENLNQSNFKFLEAENIRIKHKLNQSSIEFEKFSLLKNEEIHNLQKNLNEISTKIFQFENLEENYNTLHKRYIELEKNSKFVLTENEKNKEILERTKQKYYKYKMKYKKQQYEINDKIKSIILENHTSFSIIQLVEGKQNKNELIFANSSQLVIFKIENSSFSTLNKRKNSNPIKIEFFEKLKELMTKTKESYLTRLKSFETKTFVLLKTKLAKIDELKSKLNSMISKKKSEESFDYKKELMQEVNKFNEINTALSNKISKLEVEKTKLFYQIQNYENAVKKNEKKIKSLGENLSENQNTIVKLNLKVEGLMVENSKIIIKDLNSSKEDLDREKGMNFILNKKVFVKET